MQDIYKLYREKLNESHEAAVLAVFEAGQAGASTIVNDEEAASAIVELQNSLSAKGSELEQAQHALSVSEAELAACKEESAAKDELINKVANDEEAGRNRIAELEAEIATLKSE